MNEISEKDRVAELTAKHHEVEQALKEWAKQKNFLKSDEQIQVHSFEVVRVSTEHGFTTTVIKVPEYDIHQAEREVRLTDLDLPLRAMHAFNNKNWETVGDVWDNYSEAPFILNFGKATYRKVQTVFEALGVILPWPMRWGSEGEAVGEREQKLVEASNLQLSDWKRIKSIKWDNLHWQALDILEKNGSKPPVTASYACSMLYDFRVMNARFRVAKMPYRLRIVAQPEPKKGVSEAKRYSESTIDIGKLPIKVSQPQQPRVQQ